MGDDKGDQHQLSMNTMINATHRRGGKGVDVGTALSWLETARVARPAHPCAEAAGAAQHWGWLRRSSVSACIALIVHDAVDQHE
jgi:hypothetical protein